MGVLWRCSLSATGLKIEWLKMHGLRLMLWLFGLVPRQEAVRDLRVTPGVRFEVWVFKLIAV